MYYIQTFGNDIRIELGHCRDDEMAGNTCTSIHQPEIMHHMQYAGFPRGFILKPQVLSIYDYYHGR